MFRIISTYWSGDWDFTSAYDRRIDAVEAMAKRQANAPDVLFELVPEEQFQAMLAD